MSSKVAGFQFVGSVLLMNENYRTFGLVIVLLQLYCGTQLLRPLVDKIGNSLVYSKNVHEWYSLLISKIIIKLQFNEQNSSQ